MNDSRREFLKKATILSGAAGLTNMLPQSIQKAMAIDASPGTTFHDAEHIVFLMQENRSFDHLFGCMKGVRGFNDPRAKWLPDHDKVWIQRSKNGDAHAPFHIDINKTKITWQGGLPHSWPDQSAARNHGRHDHWIPAKSEMTMGYYDRSDVPFYYAMADAFTICDHYFCSSLTGTTPNRLFFWTGNIRPHPNDHSTPAIHNSMAESRDNAYVDWSTFPELLEEHGISWRVYQNELWTTHLDDDTDYWLGNYGDNALEYVLRHRVKLSAWFRKNGDPTVQPALTPEEVQARYNSLSEKEKNLIDKAFTTNIHLDDYLTLEPFSFTNDQGVTETVQIPKADIFHQFRKDVETGNLPAVSWLAAPQSFSDHTSTPLYGTWYVSEALDILTRNPEVWKKTIFILNYDENDGYFDHLPPFVAPRPGDPASGKVTAGINTASDIDRESGHPIGLGYRVPMIIASPWSKGGYVNSQIFDHTSTLMFLETWLSRKKGRPIQSPNISSWRRAVCGDLTSAFRPFNGETFPLPEFLQKEQVIAGIQNARNKPAQEIPTPLTHPAQWLSAQEKGTRPACALPYDLSADCRLLPSRDRIELTLASTADEMNKGAAFHVYTPDSYLGEKGKSWAYAIEAGTHLSDELPLDHFHTGKYHLCIHGPNGFFRQYKGDRNDPALTVDCTSEKKKGLSRGSTGNLVLSIHNTASTTASVRLVDNAYGRSAQDILIGPGKNKEVLVKLDKSAGWYDFTLTMNGSNTFSKQYAGHVETGRESITDPLMGGAV